MEHEKGPLPYTKIEDVRVYALLANRTLAPNVRDGSVMADWPLGVPTVLNAVLGLSSETGEINEIIKKWLFHGHPMTAEVLDHLLKEVGDLMWYVALLCFAFEFDLAEVMAMNINKLAKRYPAGFRTEDSINRAPEDI